MDARKFQIQHFAQRADQHRLAESWNAFEQDVSVGEQPDHQPLGEVALSDDDFSNFREERADDGEIAWNGEGALLTRPGDVVRWTAIDLPSFRFLDACSRSLPLDEALAAMLRTVPSVPGDAHAEKDERGWSFEPEDPWPAGRYELVALSILEDLAGNSLERPFETQEGNGALPSPTQSVQARTFVPLR